MCKLKTSYRFLKKILTNNAFHFFVFRVNVNQRAVTRHYVVNIDNIIIAVSTYKYNNFQLFIIMFSYTFPCCFSFVVPEEKKKAMDLFWLLI